MLAQPPAVRRPAALQHALRRRTGLASELCNAAGQCSRLLSARLASAPAVRLNIMNAAVGLAWFARSAALRVSSCRAGTASLPAAKGLAGNRVPLLHAEAVIFATTDLPHLGIAHVSAQVVRPSFWPCLTDDGMSQHGTLLGLMYRTLLATHTAGGTAVLLPAADRRRGVLPGGGAGQRLEGAGAVLGATGAQLPMHRR